MTIGSKGNVLTIVTPEGVSFPLLLASPVARGVAWVIDVALIVLADGIIQKIIAPFGFVSRDVVGAMGVIIAFALMLGYPIMFEWLWNGRTLGKRLMGLRVMDAAGLNLAFSQIVIRNLLRAIDNVPLFYLVGGTTCMATRYYQRLGDLAAQTVVVRTTTVGPPDLTCLEFLKFNSLRDHPHLMARMRKAVEPDEAAVLLDALLRRATLAPEARTAIYAEFAAHFKAKVPFPQDALDGLSDERYLHNVADILYRR